MAWTKQKGASARCLFHGNNCSKQCVAATTDPGDKDSWLCKAEMAVDAYLAQRIDAANVMPTNHPLPENTKRGK